MIKKIKKKEKKLNRLFAALICLSLFGWPKEENDAYCEKVLVCQDDRESFCEKEQNGGGEVCHYFLTEHCWTECKGEEDESR